MKKKEKQKSSPETISTLLGRDTVIDGVLEFKETIRVDGRIKGKVVSSDGTLIVGEKAGIEADIKVKAAIIRGKVEGRIEASQLIEIYAPAEITGDICAPTISIDAGVVFNGNCSMSNSLAPAGQKPKAPAVKVDQAKNSKNL